jgi:hypothetical protein
MKGVVNRKTRKETKGSDLNIYVPAAAVWILIASKVVREFEEFGDGVDCYPGDSSLREGECFEKR